MRYSNTESELLPNREKEKKYRLNKIGSDSDKIYLPDTMKHSNWNSAYRPNKVKYDSGII